MVCDLPVQLNQAANGVTTNTLKTKSNSMSVVVWGRSSFLSRGYEGRGAAVRQV